MTQVQLVSEFDVGLSECLAFMADPGLHEYLATLDGVAHRRVTGMRQVGSQRYWQVEVGVREQLPRFAQGFVRPDQLQWVQKFEMDMDRLEFRFTVEHPLPSSALQASGVGRVEAMGPEKSRIVIDATISSRVPMLGSRIEAQMAARIREMMAQDTRLRQEYIARHRGDARPIEVDEDGNPRFPEPRST